MTAQEILRRAASRVEKEHIEATLAIVTATPVRVLDEDDPGDDFEGAFDLLHKELGHGPPLQPWTDSTSFPEQANALRRASRRQR
jgi:hypothetical protein